MTHDTRRWKPATQLVHAGTLRSGFGEMSEAMFLTQGYIYDTAERAGLMAEKIGAANLRFGYGLPLAKAREWGLYISTSRGKTSIGVEEPALFSEPGVFLIRPDRTIYYLSVQSMPFVRPNFAEMLQALDFIIKQDYPARGEYAGAV